METVKETKEYTIYKKRNGRFGVKSKDKKWLNGEQKVEILVKEGLLKVQLKKKEEAPAAETTAETPAE